MSEIFGQVKSLEMQCIFFKNKRNSRLTTGVTKWPYTAEIFPRLPWKLVLVLNIYDSLVPNYFYPALETNGIII